MVVDVDPDAIWKPGFTGAVVYPPTPPPRQLHDAPPAGRSGGEPAAESVEVVPEGRPLPGADAPARGRTGRRGVAVAVLAAAIVATGGFVVLTGPADERATAAGVPAAGREQWTETVAGNVLFAATATDDTLILAIGFSAELVALDLATGQERWRHDLGTRASVTLYPAADVVVVADTDFDAGAQGFSIATGRPLWSRPGETVIATEQDAERLVAVRYDDRSGDPIAVQLVDGRTGEAVDSIGGPNILYDGRFVRRTGGGALEWFDAATFELLGSVDALEGGKALTEQVVATTDRGDVFATGRQVALLDADGDVIARTALDDDHGTIVALDAAGDQLLVVQQNLAVDTIVALDLTDGLRRRWVREGRLIDHADAEEGAVALIGIAPVTVDGPRFELVDTNGRLRWSGTIGPPSTAVWPVALTPTGFVTTTPTGRTELVVVGLDGRVRWRRPAQEFAEYIGVPGAVVEARHEPLGSLTITLLS